MAALARVTRRPVCHVTVLAFAIATGSAAAAEAQAPFSFAEATALQTSCAGLVTGVDVGVRNETAQPQTLYVRLGAITDSAKEAVDPAAVCGGLTAAVTDPVATTDAAGKQTPTRVAPGADAVITLRATRTPTGEETYTTNIVVYAAEGAVTRRALTISEKKVTGTAALPAIESRDVTHQRFNPDDEWIVWVPVKLASTKEPALADGATLGVLSGEHGVAAVTYGDEDPKELTDETSLVPLHIEAVGAGKYSGKVDLTPDDPTTGAVSLSLTAKHWWPLALVPLLFGISIALGVQWITGYWVTRGRLLKRVRDTGDVRDEARGRLQEAARGADWGKFDVVDLAVLQKELREEVGRRTERKEVTIDQKIVDDLGAKIDALEKKIGAIDTIAKAAPLLIAAIARLADERPADLPPLEDPDLARERPRLVDAANELVDGKPLPADELVALVTAIATMTAAVRALHKHDHALAHYWSLAGELERRLPAADQQEVAALKSRLIGLRHGLWDAASANLVDSTAESFDKVREKIDELWPRLPDPPPLPPHVRIPRSSIPALAETMLTARTLGMRTVARPALGGAVVVFDEADLDLAELIGEAARATAPPAVPPAAPPPTAAPPPPPRPLLTPTRPSLSEAEASRLIDAARRTQWVVLGTSILFAIVTGLGALYVGKAWGTPWDYIFALAWGLTTQAVIATIAGAISGLGALGALREGMGRRRL